MAMSFMAEEQLVRTRSLCSGGQRGGSRTRPPIFWGGVILLSIVLVITGSWAVRRYGLAALRGIAGAPPRLEVYGEVPTFSLTERNGGRVSRENLLGTVWIADFIFTRCLATCPQQTATMAQLQNQLAFEPDLRLVSITVDPDFDTPEILRQYADRYHADPQRWLFLTGEERAIYVLAQEGFHLAAAVNQAAAPTPVARAFSGVSSDPVPRPENGPAAVTTPADPQASLVHDVRFALVDRRARIRGYYSSLDPEAIARLRQDVRTLLAHTE